MPNRELKNTRPPVKKGSGSEGKSGIDSSLNPSPNPSTPDYADKPYTTLENSYGEAGPRSSTMKTVESIQHKRGTQIETETRGTGAATQGTKFKQRGG
jgi:hypothetical protein